MKNTKVILIISKSVMLFGRNGIIFGQTDSAEIDPMTFDAGQIPSCCIADMERLMSLQPDSYGFEVYRFFGSIETKANFFSVQ